MWSIKYLTADSVFMYFYLFGSATELWHICFQLCQDSSHMNKCHFSSMFSALPSFFTTNRQKIPFFLPPTVRRGFCSSKATEKEQRREQLHVSTGDYITLDCCCWAPVGAGVQRLHWGQGEHWGGEVAPQRAVPILVLPLRGWDAMAGKLADWAWVVGIRSWRKHRGQVG